jgi:iron(II)-dependent oxidoreductase
MTDLASGYIPLLVRFSEEDKAAKGLRKLVEAAAPEPAVWFSALEMVAEYPALVLTGVPGSGKTTFARHLAGCLASGRDPAAKALPRNDEGAVRDEVWSLGPVQPRYIEADGRPLAVLLGDDGHPAETPRLLILDNLDTAANGSALLAEARALQEHSPGLRILALGETSVVQPWVLPAGFVRHDLLPLLVAQRKAALHGDHEVGVGPAAANPAGFALALACGHAGDEAEGLVDAWLANPTNDAETVTAAALAALDGTSPVDLLPPLARSRRVQQWLAARHLASAPPEAAVARFRQNPALWAPVLQSLARRLARRGEPDALVSALLQGEGNAAARGALLAAEMDLPDGPSRDRRAALILAIVTEGRLTAPERREAGRILARLGDPRDLAELVEVPAGTLTMGSDAHPNSSPPHQVFVPAFRIGRYPVVNALYGAFVRATGRPWRSPDGFTPERANIPATDLSWHDARAYCAWLTGIWRGNGTIAADEIVRLPTEPEWERAARGDAPDPGGETIVYPWGTTWTNDAANSEEAGFNAPCAVGLFPKGRSPFGCLDMAGQVWEWCSTLWGEDMASPSFRYPYADDGREDVDAAPSIRRVLRGGCFSSGLHKACATYRGSLEPAGFWRGNGFRIVVARD